MKIDNDHLVPYSYLAIFRGKKGKFGGTNYAVTTFHQKKSEHQVSDRSAEKWAIGQANLKGWDLQDVYRLPEYGLFAEQAELIRKNVASK